MHARKTTLRRGPGLARTCAISFALLAGPAAGQGVFSVNQPWLTPGTRSSEAYMVLLSSDDAMLVGVHCDLAKRAIVRGTHGRAAARVELPAGRSVSLRPGARRIALSGLARPLKLGERVSLLLTVETAHGIRRDVAVNAEVRNQSPVEAELRAHRR